MKALMTLLIAGGFWVAGYYCGQQPNSPHLLNWASQKAQQKQQESASAVVADVMRAGQRQIAAMIGSPSQEKQPAEAVAQVAAQPVEAAKAQAAAAVAEHPAKVTIPDCY